MATNEIGVLLTNIGSPDSATPASVRKYLKKFLSDPRVVELPKLVWLPILYGIILPFRSNSSAKLYQKIWTENCSPLKIYSEKLDEKLSEELNLSVAIGMHYGNPDIESALNQLKHCKKILVLPLYPQYSATTTAASFDQVANILKKWRKLPEIQTISSYGAQESYLQAIADSIKPHALQHLLFSFHSIPEKFSKKGDPYFEECQTTANRIAEKLQLSKNQWSLSFQSRLGRAKWLSPYTQEMLETLPKKGITDLHVICPGFAVDCLETLEEINIRGREQFLQAGGKKFQYIPCLNDSDQQIFNLRDVIMRAASRH